MQLDSARVEDLETIYRMGFDAWGGASDLAGYLDACRASSKYASGRWFVLRRARSEIVCAGLVHDFGEWEGRAALGFGSLATEPALRRRGYGGALLEAVTRRLLSEKDAGVVLLYSDIHPSFYEKRGYRVLHERHPQHRPAVLMARLEPTLDPSWLDRHAARIPSYF